MPADAILVGLLVLGFLIGFFRGAIRSVLAIGAWGVCFLFASYLRVPLGEWLAGSASFSATYAYLVAYSVIFFGLFLTLFAIIMISRASTEWTRHAVVDDVLGGIASVALTVLVIASVVVMLDRYSPSVNEVSLAADVYRGLEVSAIAGFVRDSVVEGIAFALGPFLPADILVVMS